MIQITFGDSKKQLAHNQFLAFKVTLKVIGESYSGETAS